MADEDEIDILGDFSFNSCFAQNNQGIPSCSSREDTVHPQWFLDSTATNWYDTHAKTMTREKEKKRIPRHDEPSPTEYENIDIFAMWNPTERALLAKEMAKYGRNFRKISETIKTKTEAEIQALIEAEYGVNLDTPRFGLEKPEDHDNVPAVVQEEIVTDDTPSGPIKTTPRKPFRKKTYNKSKNSLLKPNVLDDIKTDLVAINQSELFYEEDLTIGSTELIGSDLDSTDIVSKNIVKYQKGKVSKKIGNHRRKVKPLSKNKDVLLKSPPGRQRNDSSLSEGSTKSPKMQIVLGSGQALPVSEGEQVIKIEKKKDSEPESDIDIDVDSGNEDNRINKDSKEDQPPKLVIDEAPIAVPLRKFEPMPRRKKKFNLEGGGGCTIMHTAAGEFYSVAPEPQRRRERRAPEPLVRCRPYGPDMPAPFVVQMHVSALISMDVHAHTSRREVMGLIGGRGEGDVSAYWPAAAAASGTHCDMDPVSQARASSVLMERGLVGVGWHHSHPSFGAWPSPQDLRTQRALQRALERASPLMAVITSQHWAVGRAASHYRCIRVDASDDSDPPAGFQLSARLHRDLNVNNVEAYLCQLPDLLAADERTRDPMDHVCPHSGRTYLDKCLSSVAHHMRSAGYPDEDLVTLRLLEGLRRLLR